MAEQELQKPPAASGPEPVIHVIPEKFYGAALKQKAAKLPPTPPAPPSTPPPASPPPDLPATPAPKKKPSFPYIPVIVGVAVLLIGGLVAFFLLYKPAAPVVNTPVVNTPVGPVCGNGTCDAGESTATCAADCPAPTPVCGNSICDTGETTASCAADCPPLGPVCGDARCDAGETTEACPADCRPVEPVPAADSDSDGLTDEEERLIYGTDPNDPNSDKDRYVDLNEVLSLYDPAKPEPAPLRENPGITSYLSAALGIDLLRPSSWTVNAQAETGEVTLTSSSGESVQVRAVAKPAETTLADWYRAQFPQTAAQGEPYRTRQGYEAIATADRLTVYVDGGAKVLVVTYDLGASAEIRYKVTFQMIVQSLRLLPAN